MDTRRTRRTILLLAVLAAGAATAGPCGDARGTYDRFAPARQLLRAVTDLIDAHGTERPPAPMVTIGTRG